MNTLLRILFLSLTTLIILSCTPSTPYEIKSPCVSIDSEISGIVTPCVRRPINMTRAIV